MILHLFYMFHVYSHQLNILVVLIFLIPTPRVGFSLLYVLLLLISCLDF